MLGNERKIEIKGIIFSLIGLICDFKNQFYYE